MPAAPRLKEIAGKFQLEAKEILAMDAQGRDAAGQPYRLPVQTELVQGVFANDTGADTEAIDGRDQGLVWYHVDAIEPARDRTLDEAKGDVVAAWKREETAKRLQARAEELLKELGTGKTLEDVAKAAGLEVKQAWGLKRNGEARACRRLPSTRSSRPRSRARDRPVRQWHRSHRARGHREPRPALRPEGAAERRHRQAALADRRARTSSTTMSASSRASSASRSTGTNYNRAIGGGEG